MKIFPRARGASRRVFRRLCSGRFFSRATFSPRPLGCRFCRSVCAPDTTQFALLQGHYSRGASHPDFSPNRCAAVYFRALRALFFLQLLRSRFFRDASHPRDTPVCPASPPIFPRSPPLFPRPLRVRFFPQSKVLRAPWVSHPCAVVLFGKRRKNSTIREEPV